MGLAAAANCFRATVVAELPSPAGTSNRRQSASPDNRAETASVACPDTNNVRVPRSDTVFSNGPVGGKRRTVTGNPASNSTNSSASVPASNNTTAPPATGTRE